MNNNELSWDSFIAMGYGEKKVYKKNEILFHPGEIGKGFYYLLAGEVKISVISREGHERDIDYVTPGELIGVQGIQNEPYTYTAKATISSTVYFFSNLMFNQLCAKLPEAASVRTNSLIMKVRLLAESINILTAPAEYRLAHFLYGLYLKKEDPKIKISRTSLGHFIGTSRITVYKIIRQLEQDGLIEINKGYIYLLDIYKLKTFLDSSLRPSHQAYHTKN
ncbi:Crp/Fnr family transcriptional regulator [Neobacillus novalis]|uniref:Crp/Fnr family transcriptional regulator n=1 Tax=Neobacillus novalis TaxID=220687 RepID=A0AA95MSJ3_9BACI|nr:Crp/Fnr family transcriptional regulator [Neobacillus novalis]WHY85788.1 Crp/Fnr family transcriptional regulator [Neobacillus novalis]